MGKRILLGLALAFVLLIGYGIGRRIVFGSIAAEYPDCPFEFDYGTEQAGRWNHVSWRALRNATQDEQNAILNAYQEKYTQARKHIEAALRANRESIPAFYALAIVECRGETNLPYALFVIREARHRLERRGRAQPYDVVSKDWYLGTLQLEHEILEMMDRRKEQLRVVELLEQLHGPQPHMKVWPQLKLQRFDEARENVRLATQYGNNDTALNGLAAVEERLQHREASLGVSKRLTEMHPDKPIFWSNYGLACYNAFQFDEAERVTLKAATLGSPDFHGTAYRELSMIYVQQGRLAAAIDALRKGQAQRAARAVNTLQQDEARMEMAKAMLALALGHSQSAVKFARHAAEAPDRAGGTSIDRRDLDFSNALLLYSVLETRREQLREHAAGKPVVSSLTPDPEQTALDLELWRLERQLRRELVGDYLVNLLRPSVPGLPGLETAVASWYRGNLVQVLPPAVAQEAIRKGRSIPDMPEAVGYLDAMEAEAALRLGDYAWAIELAEQALKKLPAEGEKLLTMRVRAIAGEAHWQRGELEPALREWDQVLRTFPQAFRMLRICLPAEVQHDGSPAGKRLAECLLQSPRLQQKRGAFVIRTRTVGSRLTFEMFRLHRARHFEGSVKLGEQADAAIEAAVADFHERLTQPFLDVSQADINSLDGSPAAAQYRGQVEDLFGPGPAKEKAKEKPTPRRERIR